MNTSTYTVTGMSCGGCAASVREEISEIEGVTEVVVDLPTGAVGITSSRRIPRTEVSSAVEEAGYELATP